MEQFEKSSAPDTSSRLQRHRSSIAPEIDAIPLEIDPRSITPSSQNKLQLCPMGLARLAIAIQIFHKQLNDSELPALLKSENRQATLSAGAPLFELGYSWLQHNFLLLLYVYDNLLYSVPLSSSELFCLFVSVCRFYHSLHGTYSILNIKEKDYSPKN